MFVEDTIDVADAADDCTEHTVDSYAEDTVEATIPSFPLLQYIHDTLEDSW